MTQYTEYTCDWCHQRVEARLMNRVFIEPVQSKVTDWDEVMKQARRRLADYYRKDICVPCLEKLVAPLEEKRP